MPNDTSELNLDELAGVSAATFGASYFIAMTMEKVSDDATTPLTAATSQRPQANQGGPNRPR